MVLQIVVPKILQTHDTRSDKFKDLNGTLDVCRMEQ